MKRVLLAVVLVMSFSSSAFGQTISSKGLKYAGGFEKYRIQIGGYIWTLAPTFANEITTDNQVIQDFAITVAKTLELDYGYGCDTVISVAVPTRRTIMISCNPENYTSYTLRKQGTSWTVKKNF